MGRPSKADGLAREVGAGELVAAARRVALAEQQIEDVEHGPEPLGPLGFGRQLEGFVGFSDLRLGPAYPLGHRRFGNEKRSGNLARRESADRPKGQRDRAGWSQRRMTAHEHENEGVIGTRCRIRRIPRPRSSELLTPPSGIIASILLPHAPRGHSDQPAQWMFGHSAHRPLLGGDDECLLHSIFGIREVPVASSDCTEGLRRQLAQQSLGARRPAHSSGSGALITSRTSMRCPMGAPPRPGAAEIRAASSTARSVDSTSTMR